MKRYLYKINKNRRSPFTRRASWHDYYSRCVYLITMPTIADSPVLCTIKNIGTIGSPLPWYELSEAGEIVKACMEWLPTFYPHTRIIAKVIMPDHIHMVLFVKRKTGVSLDAIMNRFTCAINYLYFDMLDQRGQEKEFLFSGEYNDKIAMRPGQYENFKKYVRDNPRRYLIRNLHPDFFQRINKISIEGEEYSAFGNLFLLRHPIKTLVRFSRAFDKATIDENYHQYRETIRQGGVFVSPFIHPQEKSIYEWAIKVQTSKAGDLDVTHWRGEDNLRKASIIRIVSNGFGPRFKPSGREWELCAKGRLLLVGPAEYQTRKIEPTRELFMKMNHLAEKLVALPPEAIMRILRGK